MTQQQKSRNKDTVAALSVLLLASMTTLFVVLFFMVNQ